MVTRERLYQLKNLKAEKKMWEDKLKEMREKYDSLSVGNAIRGSDVSDRTGELASSTADIIDTIERLKGDIVKEEAFLIAFITSLEDTVLRQIVHYKCVEDMTWLKVGLKMGMPEETAKTIFYRHFES